MILKFILKMQNFWKKFSTYKILGNCTKIQNFVKKKCTKNYNLLKVLNFKILAKNINEIKCLEKFNKNTIFLNIINF